MHSLSLLLVVLSSTCLFGQRPRITVRADQKGVSIGSGFYSIFLEEISRAGEGGLYPQLVQNGSFEDSPSVIWHWRDTLRGQMLFGVNEIRETLAPHAWSLVQRHGAGRIALDWSKPLNPSNPTALRLVVDRVEKEGVVGAASEGYLPFNPKEKRESSPALGIPLNGGAEYVFSLFARADGGSPPILARLEDHSGRTLAEASIGGLGDGWKRLSTVLKPTRSELSGRLVVGLTKPGTVYVDMVSLLPRDTTKTGLRKDLVDMLRALRPATMRFPGGCFTEGMTLELSDRWKWTVGPLEERKGHPSHWGYYSHGHLGYLEYLRLAEDLGAEPIFCINAGMTHEELVPLDRLVKNGWIQDALDAIEYANGPETSKWGAMRAAHGRKEPFRMKYIEIGNENHREEYYTRFNLFYDAIKKKYPEITVIANHVAGGYPPDRKVEMIDAHKYGGTYFDRISRDLTQWQRYDRAKPKVFLSEYAFGFGGNAAGKGNMRAAVADAAYVLGLERNADVILMTCYAPLLCSADYQRWTPNAIWFNGTGVYGTPTYHMMKLFAEHRPDYLVASTVQNSPQVPNPKSGAKPESTDGLIVNAGRSDKAGEIILKVLNATGAPIDADVKIEGAASVKPGTAWAIASPNPEDENSFESPNKIAARKTPLESGAVFRHEFPAYSISVLRFPARLPD